VPASSEPGMTRPADEQTDPDSMASDPGPEPFLLADLEFSLDTAPLDALEEVTRSVTPAQVGEWFRHSPGTEEVALLSTCHRVELVLLSRSPREVTRWVERLPGPRASWRVRDGRDVVHHLFRVAVGRESLAMGEREVRHQVRAAGRRVESRHPRPILRALFARAAETADEVAPSVQPSRSIAAVAATRVLELSGQPFPRVVVVGAGAVGRQVTELLSPTARVTLVYHERPPDVAFLRNTGARAARLDQLAAELVVADAVVTAAKSGVRCVRPSDIPLDHPLVLVDLGVPRNIDPSIRELPNVCLVDLEDLHARPGAFRPPEGLDDRVEAEARAYSERMDLSLLEPWIDALRRAGEDVRRAEFAAASPFLGDLDSAQRVAVERLTRRLVSRLLQPPAERIRALPPGPEGDRLRRFALDLLGPSSVEP
jgi:glutamyl-tRNA reductase